MSNVRLAAAVLCLLHTATGALAADAVPGEPLIGKTGFSALRLSPDGQYVAGIVRTPEQPQARNLATLQLADGQIRVITGYSDIDVSWFAWANDTRLLFGTESRSGQPGQPLRYRGAFAIDRDGSSAAMVERTRELRMSFLARVPGDKDGVLITRPGKQPGLVDVFRLDLRHGATRKLADNEHELTVWLPDNAGRVRAAIGRGAGAKQGRARLFYRALDEKGWKELAAFDAADFRLLAFHPDNRRLIAASRVGRERFVLLELEPDEPFPGKVLVADPGHDVFRAGDSVLTQSRTGHLVSYRYPAERLRTVYFDRRWEGRQADIDEILPDSVNIIVNFSDDERKLLVLSTGERGRGDYYLFDDIVRQLKFLVARAD